MNTHAGTCQVCGRVIPYLGADRGLSRHHYPRRLEFARGRCPGTGHPPIELDVRLLFETVQAMGTAIIRLQETVSVGENRREIWKREQHARTLLRHYEESHGTVLRRI